MRFIKNIMSRKTEPEELAAPLDMDDMDIEPMDQHKSREPEADDTGTPNASLSSQQAKLEEAKRLFGLEVQGASSVGDQDDLPDPAPASAASDDWDDTDWDDTDWDDDDWDDDEDEDIGAEAEKTHLVDEIREAMGAVSHITPEEKAAEAAPKSRAVPGEKDWSMDEEFGRKAIARKELGIGADESEQRLMDEAEDMLEHDKEGSRRRSALAHLKAAAKATKNDRVLAKSVGRDPSSDPEEQSPYRADLAKVVRPRATSRPAARIGSRPSPQLTAEDASADKEDSNSWIDMEPDFDAAPSVTADDIAAAAESGDVPPAGGEPEQFVPRATRTRKIWELGDADLPGDDEPAAASEPEDSVEEVEAPQAEAEAPAAAQQAPVDTDTDNDPGLGFAVPQPAKSGRVGRNAGRVKTRLLGFQQGDQSRDVFATTEAEAPEADPTQPAMFPVGWIVVLDGPGRGASFTLFTGVSQIGRGDDQAIRLDFGDNAISRQNHAAVAFDHEAKKFFLGHGGKSNLVRLNDRPVLSTEELTGGDTIRIGETTLKFIALCGEDFGWEENAGDDSVDAVNV